MTSWQRKFGNCAKKCSRSGNDPGTKSFGTCVRKCTRGAGGTRSRRRRRRR